jgi:hypothetical protein
MKYPKVSPKANIANGVIIYIIKLYSDFILTNQSIFALHVKFRLQSNSVFDEWRNY